MSGDDEKLIISRYMKRIRQKVDPRRCARTHEQAVKAARASWAPKVRLKRALAKSGKDLLRVYVKAISRQRGKS